MRRRVLAQAGELLRRALVVRSPLTFVAAAAEEATGPSAELRLLGFLAADVGDRARTLRIALRSIDSEEPQVQRAMTRALAEVDLLDDLASSVSDLMLQSEGAGRLEPIELLDTFRRARARFAQRAGSELSIRINSPVESPRVMANDAALVRTISLCLEASAGGVVVPRGIVVHVGDEGDRIRATFRPEEGAGVARPRMLERVRSALAMASRLATTFGAELEVAHDRGLLVPRLALVAAPA
jgi:hypothetical protein